MLRREFAQNRPHGGIVADHMGLGKTVEVLAVVAANHPSEKDIAKGRIITLIVVPANTIPQWVSEIKKHLTRKLRENLLHYKASKKLGSFVFKQLDIM